MNCMIYICKYTESGWKFRKKDEVGATHLDLRQNFDGFLIEPSYFLPAFGEIHFVAYNPVDKHADAHQ